MTEKKINILLVEDDVFLANIYKTKFAMEGFEVVLHAENGDLAIVEANRKKPDIILLDILLPKKDGFAVLTELKKENSEVKDIPVILLTNLGQKDDVEKGLEMGAEDYLIKAHFKPSEVVEKVRKILKI